MKLKRLAQTAALLLITVPILGCGDQGLPDECSGRGANMLLQCNIDVLYQTKVLLAVNASEAGTKTNNVEKVDADLVFYNMNNGQYTEILTKSLPGIQDPKNGLWNYSSSSHVDSFWGVGTFFEADEGLEEVDCIGVRQVINYNDGTAFTVLGWRDDSDTTLTAENSIQGVGYSNKDEEFFRSFIVPKGRKTNNILHYVLDIASRVADGNKVNVELNATVSYEDSGRSAITYKEYIETTGRSSVNNGDYFADPDPSRCNIINSP